MKRLLIMTICVLALSGCGGSNASRRLDEAEKKNQDLVARVESLEKQLLDAQKQLIAHQQAMQTIRAQQRDMENYFNKLQSGSTQ